jgi:hypothetical protein
MSDSTATPAAPATFWQKVEAFFAMLESGLEKAAPVINDAAKIAEVVAPFTGSAAPAVEAGAQAADQISAAVTTATAAHDGSPQSAAVLGAAVLQSVASSGLIKNATTAGQLTGIASVLAGAATQLPGPQG